MSKIAPDETSSSDNDGRSASVVVIGNFDGVHRGHLGILERGAALAQAEQLKFKVLTFDPHPRQVVSGRSVPVLTRTVRKRGLLEAMGLSIEVVVYPFTSQTAQLSPEAFCTTILKDQLGAEIVVVGENFRFGQGRAGDLQALVSIGKQHAMRAMSETLRGDRAGPFSSTRVRALLSEGQLDEARLILGRPHLISGLVVRGAQQGRTLGFPTANLEQVPEVRPKDGVYAVHVYDLSAGARYLGPGALNLGARPTVERPHGIEVHVIGYQGDLYGKELAVELLAQIRPVMKFENVTMLKQQIAHDVQTSLSLLTHHTPSSVASGFA